MTETYIAAAIFAKLLLEYEQIWFWDFEFISKPGEHPDVVCLCAKELRSGQTVRLWRDQLAARRRFAPTPACCSFALPLPQKWPAISH